MFNRTFEMRITAGDIQPTFQVGFLHPAHRGSGGQGARDWQPSIYMEHSGADKLAKP